ncbi:MAG: amino acid--tRNA ligase-related protein, partial [Myxococcota bacterium]
PLHNPEFTGLEWYAIHADYHRLMERTEAMCLSLWPEQKLGYQGQLIDLSPPWPRYTVHQAFLEYANLHLPAYITRDDLVQACQQHQLSVHDDDLWDDLFFKLFLTLVEPHLGRERPIFLTEYPIQMAALARPKPQAPHVAERVELYIAGLELANGYSELTDPYEQRRRWEADAAIKNQEYHRKYPIDPQFLAALEHLPPCTGIAVGIDRLLMLHCDAASIQEVLPFPMYPARS